MPTNKLGSLNIEIAADVAQLRRDMSSAERTIKGSTDKMAASARVARNALIGIGSALVSGAAIRSIVNATVEQEAAVRQLEQGLASTGNVVGRSLDELTKKASELQNVTTFGDERIIAAQSRLLTFTSIVGDQFDRTTEAALDLSARMGTDLNSAVLQLGKALNDPVKNLSALSRAGIQFSDSQRDLIKQLAETGRLAEAQDVILEELETQFGGSARAARDTFGGALTSLNNAFGDLLESESGLSAAKDEIEKLTRVLQDPRTAEGVDTLTSLLIRLGTAAAGVVANLGNRIDTIGFYLAAITGNLSPLDKLEKQIRDVERALDGNPFTTPIQFRLTSDEDLRELRTQLQAQLDLVSKSLVGVNVPIKTPSPVPDPVKDPAIVDPAAPETEDAFRQKADRINEIMAKLERDIDAANKRLEDRANSITVSVITDTEQFKRDAAELETFLEAGLITEETRNRKLAEYKDILAETTPGIQSMVELQEALTATLSPQELELQRLTDQLIELELAMGEFPEKAAQIQEAIRRTQGEIDNISSPKPEGADPAESETNEFGKNLRENVQRELGGVFRDVIAGDFDDIEDGFVRMLETMAAQAAAAELTQLMFGSTGQAGGSSLVSGEWEGLFTSILGSFGGARATGGPVESNKAYLVGERGPELFVPRGMGEIIPNHSLTGGSGMVLTQNINVPPSTDNRTAHQIANESARRQRLAQARFGA